MKSWSTIIYIFAFIVNHTNSTSQSYPKIYGISGNVSSVVDYGYELDTNDNSQNLLTIKIYIFNKAGYLMSTETFNKDSVLQSRNELFYKNNKYSGQLALNSKNDTLSITRVLSSDEQFEYYEDIQPLTNTKTLGKAVKEKGIAVKEIISLYNEGYFIDDINLNYEYNQQGWLKSIKDIGQKSDVIFQTFEYPETDFQNNWTEQIAHILTKTEKKILVTKRKLNYF